MKRIRFTRVQDIEYIEDLIKSAKIGLMLLIQKIEKM